MQEHRHPSPPDRRVSRGLLGTLFIAAGVLHFARPQFYLRIIPPFLPSPAALVAVSGAAEIAGGAGLFVRPLRRAAVWGLIALLVAVMPANVYMAVAPPAKVGFEVPPQWMWLRQLLLWLRLPLQGVLIAWVWSVRGDGGGRTPDAQ